LEYYYLSFSYSESISDLYWNYVTPADGHVDVGNCDVKYGYITNHSTQHFPKI